MDGAHGHGRAHVNMSREFASGTYVEGSSVVEKEEQHTRLPPKREGGKEEKKNKPARGS